MQGFGKHTVKVFLGAIGIAIASLTAHVTLQEATVTKTGLPNVPDSVVIENLKTTCEYIYEPTRAHFGKPIYISSGFRSKQVNKAVGGKLYSQHLYGEALDLDADVYGGLTNTQLFFYIQNNLEFDQLIFEGGAMGWVHVSYRKGNNRKQVFYLQ